MKVKQQRTEIKNKAFKELRINAGFKTADVFAQYAEIDKSSVRRYEQLGGTFIPIWSAWKIADALKCSIDDVVGREMPEKSTVNISSLSDESKQELHEYIKYLKFKDLMNRDDALA